MKKVCGLDVHKDSIFLCILFGNGRSILEEFSTLTPDIELMRGLLLKNKVSDVAMESTGVYWIPIWRMLEGYFTLHLVNPYLIKQMPGRKTDVKDAQWIATVLQKNLIRGSYIPEQQILELRQYERKYVRLSEQVTRIEVEIDRHLHRCNIRITNFATKIGSVSVMNVVNSIVRGETNPNELTRCVHGAIKNRHKEKIKAALTGFISETDRFILEQNIKELELVRSQQQVCIDRMEHICDKRYQKETDLLCTIPGIKKLSAMMILAELGNDMKVFKTASALVGWAGLRPRNDESAGKIKSRKITNGNKYLRRILVQCAWGMSRTKGCWLNIKYQELAKRLSSKKALIAIARKLLEIIWHVLSKHEEYRDYKPRLNPLQKVKKIARLEKQLMELQAS